MPNKDVVKNKLSAMSTYFEELMPYIEDTKKGTITVKDPKVYIIERLFLLIVDAAIDINTHIITRNKFESPDDYEGTFTILGKNKIIPNKFALKISGSVGLRNRMTHGYEKVERQVMLDYIVNGIGMYSEYMKYINGYMDGLKA